MKLVKLQKKKKIPLFYLPTFFFYSLFDYPILMCVSSVALNSRILFLYHVSLPYSTIWSSLHVRLCHIITSVNYAPHVYPRHVLFEEHLDFLASPMLRTSQLLNRSRLLNSPMLSTSQPFRAPDSLALLTHQLLSRSRLLNSSVAGLTP